MKVSRRVRRIFAFFLSLSLTGAVFASEICTSSAEERVFAETAAEQADTGGAEPAGMEADESTDRTGSVSADGFVPEVDESAGAEAGSVSADRAVPEADENAGAETESVSADRAVPEADESEGAGRVSADSPAPEAGENAGAETESVSADRAVPEAGENAGTEIGSVSADSPALETGAENREKEESRRQPAPDSPYRAAAEEQTYPICVPCENVTIEDVVGSKIMQMGRAGHSSVTQAAGGRAVTQHCAPYHIRCSRCKKTYYVIAPTGYVGKEVTFSNPEVAGDGEYLSGPWTEGNTMEGSECLYLSCLAKKPGYTQVDISYYTAYVTADLDRRCAECRTLLSTANHTDAWYACTDYFNLNVYADYTVKYDPNAGADEVRNMPKNVSRRYYSTSGIFRVTREEPARDGYFFRGWSEDKEAQKGEYQRDDSLVLDWKEGPAVEKTLYAVWEKILTGGGSVIPVPDPEPDLTVIKTACGQDEKTPVTSVEAGEAYSYVVTVRNNTDREWNDLQVSENLNPDYVRLLNNPIHYENGIWTIERLEAQGTATLILPVEALAETPEYENTVCLAMKNSDGEYEEVPMGEDDTPTASVEIRAVPELTIKKEADRQTASVCDTVAYTVTVTNPGRAATAGEVRIQDPLPGELEWTGASYQKGGEAAVLLDTEPAEGLYEIGDLGAQEEALLTITARILKDDIRITNVARACRRGGSEVEDSADIQVLKEPEPDLTVVKTAFEKDTDLPVASVETGEVYRYVVKVTNNTDREMKDLQVSENLEPGFVRLLNHPEDYENGIWTMERLEARETATLILYVEALAANPRCENTVRVRMRKPDGVFREVPMGDDDRPTAVVEIREVPELTIKKEADRQTASLRDVITYKITVTNPAVAAAAREVRIRDSLPEELRWLSASLQKGRDPSALTKVPVILFGAEPAGGIYKAGDLDAQEGAVLTITARVRKADVRITNIAGARRGDGPEVTDSVDIQVRKVPKPAKDPDRGPEEQRDPEPDPLPEPVPVVPLPVPPLPPIPVPAVTVPDRPQALTADSGPEKEPVKSEGSQPAEEPVKRVERFDPQTPLAGQGHRCCILHFAVLLLALLTELFYMRSAKKYQNRRFALRRELAADREK